MVRAGVALSTVGAVGSELDPQAVTKMASNSAEHPVAVR
jgi:hypothetical protein